MREAQHVRGKSHLRGRSVLLACLNCAQAIAADWPFLILWPCLRAVAASAIVRWSRPFVSGRKRQTRRVRSHGKRKKAEAAAAPAQCDLDLVLTLAPEKQRQMLRQGKKTCLVTRQLFEASVGSPQAP
jgi:hypothetical protein